MILYLGKEECHCKLIKMKNKFSLQNKTAIITGGGSGIGEAIAQTFANQDAKVFIIDQNLDAANKTVEKINNELKRDLNFKEVRNHFIYSGLCKNC